MSAVPAGAEDRDIGKPAMDGLAVTLMLLLTLSWGLNQIAIKVSNAGFNPMFGVLVRAAGGGLLVFLWCRWRGIALFARDGTLWPGLAAGALFGFEFVLIFAGLEFTSAARSALMVNTMPFWMLLGGHFLLGERITARKLAGLVLAFAGVVLIFSDDLSIPGPKAIWGDLLCLLAGVLWAATVLLVKVSRLSRTSPEKTLLYQLSVSALIALPLIPLYGPLLREVTTLATASLVFQTVFVVAFTYVLWFWLVRRYPASGLSSFTFLSPAFGVILAGVLLDEPLTLRIFAALGLIAAGLVLVNRAGRAGGTALPGRRNDA
ncbi:MAG: DMT family transporter [Aquamicrobium sp.]|uniref:DMT family transporter n=1 Tax=Aquamicrobium sp. TaxID=1872579 RepID=UPI00349E6763|nr:DMT family transporter [Aquamicrobium sp.]